MRSPDPSYQNVHWDLRDYREHVYSFALFSEVTLAPPPPIRNPHGFPHCLTRREVLPNSGGNYWKSHCCDILKPHHPAVLVINLPFKERTDQPFNYATTKWRKLTWQQAKGFGILVD